MVTTTIGSNLELGAGSAAMLHLALATPVVQGSGRFRASLGLGVELDDEKVARYRVDT